MKRFNWKAFLSMVLLVMFFVAVYSTIGYAQTPPIADPNGPYTSTVGQPVQFDGTGSTDPDGTIVAYDWDYGDGNAGSGATPTHTYAAAGLYTVTLTVTDDEGATDSATTNATITSESSNVPIDIKPGSCPNPFKLKCKGCISVLPAAVLGTEEFDVTTIDPETVMITREGVEAGVPLTRHSYEDVGTPFEGELCDCHELNGDGYMDLTLKFKIADLIDELKLYQIEARETIPLTLVGETYDGTPIRGEDCIWIIGKLNKPCHPELD